ncbi:TIGR02391 family protein [Kitasatospora purpeofusca]|uniref:hypothetical protein n=1 Tax=Kitasatospora purpeofusca TaxID=67352 RepID=UPI002E10E740|nr:TIGR02391 family protein [Kitasatospora purpeofusca]WSR45249.1 TIGR02391 family protein [Kitasatospora purpeofusca]
MARTHLVDLGDYETACSAAMKAIEVAVREASGLDDSLAPSGVAAGIVPGLVAAEAKPAVSRGDRLAQGLAALTQSVEREPRVPRPHKELVETAEAGGEDQVVVHQVALGSFLNNTKARRAKLSPGQLAQLAERGVGVAGRPLPGGAWARRWAAGPTRRRWEAITHWVAAFQPVGREAGGPFPPDS